MSDDNFAESVFENEVAGIESQDSGLDSWDDAEAYVGGSSEDGEEINAEGSEVAEEADAVDRDSGAESKDKDADLDEEKADKDSDEDSDEDGPKDEESEESEAGFEIPKELEEAGLVASEDGEFGKMVKIDGQEQFVSLTELGNDYSGKVAIQQRFNELDAEKRTYKAEVDEVNSYVNTFAEKMKSGDALAGMQYLGEFSGIAPYQIKRQLIEALQPEIERMYNMSATELQSEYASEENEYLKQSLESERQQFQAQQAKQELNAEVSQVRETHGIDDSEWNQALSFLSEHEQALREENPNLVMDAKYVAETVMDARAYTRADTAFSAANVNLSENQSGDVMNYLHDVAYRNPDFTQEDLIELVRSAEKSAIESKVSNELGNRLKKNDSTQSKAQQKQKPKQTEYTPQEEEILDDLWG